jgi:hypothetical protein
MVPRTARPLEKGAVRHLTDHLVGGTTGYCLVTGLHVGGPPCQMD